VVVWHWAINEVTLRQVRRLVLGWAGIAPRYVTSHPDQRSLLPSAGREMRIGHSAVMLCGWGVKAGWLIPFVDKRWVAGKTV